MKGERDRIWPGAAPQSSILPRSGCGLSPLVQKLAARTSLSPDELETLEKIHSERRGVANNRDIITEGHKYNLVFVLADGMAIRYRVLHDGRRQILNVVLPGDFIGFPACFFETALYSVTTVTNCSVAPISFVNLLGLLGEHPRIGAAMFWLFSCEAAMYAERLVGIGQRSATERLAHFLLELSTRLRVIGRADEREFQMPLTQEQIGDILGLTGVHVSRIMRQLRDDELIAVKGHHVKIINFEALSALADFERTYLSHFRMSEALLPASAAPQHSR